MFLFHSTKFSNSLLFLFILLLSSEINSLKIKTNSKYYHTSFLQSSKSDPYDINKSSITYYANGPCSAKNCDKCISTIVCQCPNGYAQDPKKTVNENEKSCSYKMKKQWAFFLFELIFPFGFGHFYAKRFLFGFCKLFALIFVVCADILVKKRIKNFKAKQNFNVGMYVLYFGYLVWHITDIVLIGINYWKDGKGIALSTLKKD